MREMRPEQAIVERDDLLGAAGCTLAPAAPEELPIDAPRLLRARWPPPRGPRARPRRGPSTDVGAAARHAGRNRDARPPRRRAATTCASSWSCRAFSTWCARSGGVEKRTQMLGRRTRSQVPTSTGRPAACSSRDSLARRRCHLSSAPRQDRKPGIAPPRRAAACGTVDGAQAVDAPQLARDLARRAGHARESQVATKEALVADARDGLALWRQRDVLRVPRSAPGCRPRSSGPARGARSADR